MSGHMGNVKRTIQNLEVVEIDSERNLIYIKGSCTGHDNSYLVITPSIKSKQEEREIFPQFDHEETPEAVAQPEETPEAVAQPEETPEAVAQPEETPEETPEAVAQSEETPEAVAQPEETPEETPEAVAQPEETPEADSDSEDENKKDK
jgi:hypothetical protein